MIILFYVVSYTESLGVDWTVEVCEIFGLVGGGGFSISLVVSSGLLDPILF